MNQHDETSPRPESPAPSPHATKRRRGAPRILDEAKRRDICALVAGGFGTREAARYVRCSYETIRRELRRNPEFREDLRRSEMFAQLSPLRAMQHAAGTHWRAAAWMLERAFPNRFARRDPAAFGPRQARSLLSEVLDIIGGEVADPFQRQRIENRLRATFEYTIRAACDQRRTSHDLRSAMKFFEEKDRLNDPLAQFGFPIPDFDSIVRPKKPAPKAAAVEPEPPKPETATHQSQPPESPDARVREVDAATLTELASAMIDCLNR